MIHSCTVQKHQLCDYRQPGLLSQAAFCRPCRTALVHYRPEEPWGAIIKIGVVSNCYQCPSRPILQIVYISVYWRVLMYVLYTANYWVHILSFCYYSLYKNCLQKSEKLILALQPYSENINNHPQLCTGMYDCSIRIVYSPDCFNRVFDQGNGCFQ